MRLSLVNKRRELPLFPLNTVLFPGMVLPLHIFEERYKLMVERCIQETQPFGVVCIKAGEEVGGSDVAIHTVGTTAQINQLERLPEGRLNIATIGRQRFRIQAVRSDHPYLTAVIEDFPLQDVPEVLVKAPAMLLTERLRTYLEIFASIGKVELPNETISALPDDPEMLSFLVAIVLQMPNRDKQILLETPDLLSLIRRESRMLHRESQILRLLIEYGLRERDNISPFSVN